MSTAFVSRTPLPPTRAQLAAQARREKAWDVFYVVTGTVLLAGLAVLIPLIIVVQFLMWVV